MDIQDFAVALLDNVVAIDWIHFTKDVNQGPLIFMMVLLPSLSSSSTSV